ncbi:diguanylate cyclase domain-containing protein [Saccharothrix australiensis]|uniref:diguanylate cyclase domain-containing protein n=1 Tax=Saccharothrix australiensis TaxID=2072 RepID=UPI001FE3074C|nr:diguanylate cyclase [Saccharothrix australiensis]
MDTPAAGGARAGGGPPESVAALLDVLTADHANALPRHAPAGPGKASTGPGSAPAERERDELRDSEARLRHVFESSATGIAIFDPDGRVVDANPALRRMLGHAEDPGREPVELFAPADLAALRAAWTTMPAGGTRVERRFTGPTGDPLWTNVALSLAHDGAGRLRYRVAVVEDVTEQRELRDYLRRQALHDVLTGLPNRQGFLLRLERAIHRPGSLTLCYLDVDCVAIVNDGIGYEAGDELLRVVARRLTAAVADEDATVARIGGDEFVVLVEDSPGTPGIPALAAAIAAELSEPVYLSGRGVGVSAGMGFVRTSARDVAPMSLLRQAHTALRRAEDGGKGQWGVYDAGQDARDRPRLALLAGLPGAVENGELAIGYRPVEHVGGPAAGTRAAVAARFRLPLPGYGAVAHEECLRCADAVGLSGRLARWLLAEACAFAAAEATPVLVRLSADQSRDPDLAAVVVAALRSSGLPPGLLWLSLDSAALTGGPDALEDNLTTLADMGVRRLLHGFACGVAEVALVQRQALHGVELDAPPAEPLARAALAAVLPLLRDGGVLVVGDVPGADLVVRR